ncbi:MAG: RluA family pseudouridine synthase [Ilyomonas sp.]
MRSTDIILEDEHLIAINKKAGMLSVPDRKQSEISLKDILLKEFGEIYTVHRLDKETSGVIVFAKSAEAHAALSQLFESRNAEKYYYGLVHGVVIPPSGNIDEPIAEHPAKNGKMIVNKKGKPSLTNYETEEQFRLFAWMKFQIHTGRTHQIRVHMQHIGHSIVCDDLYGNGEPVYLSSLKRNYHLSKKEEAERPVLSRLALHAALLKFTLFEKEYEFEAPLPKDLRALLQQLRKLNLR